MSFDTARLFLAFQLLQAPAGNGLLPSRAVHHQRTLRVCMQSHTCACLLWVPKPSVCMHRHTCMCLVWAAGTPSLPSGLLSAPRPHSDAHSEPAMGLSFGKSASGQSSGHEPAFCGSAQRLGGCSSPAASTPLSLIFFPYCIILSSEPLILPCAGTPAGDGASGSLLLPPVCLWSSLPHPGAVSGGDGLGWDRAVGSVVVSAGLLHSKAEGLVET